MVFLATDWDMWGALGQWAGAIFTAIAVTIALWQVIEMKKQANKTYQQEGVIRFLKNEDKLEIVLNNVNVAPIFVNQAKLFRAIEHPVRKEMDYQSIDDNRIQSEAPKYVAQGDVCKMLVPLDILFDDAEKNKCMFYSAYFFSTSGSIFRRSLYVECRQSQKRIFDIYIAKDQKETWDYLVEMDHWQTIIVNEHGVISALPDPFEREFYNVELLKDARDYYIYKREK